MRKKLSILLIALTFAVSALPVFAGVYGLPGGIIVVTGKSVPSK